MAAVAEAVLEIDESREHPARVVWALAWPAVALNSLQVINNLLDTTFVGRLEPAAMTAHGASVVMLFLMFSIAMSLGTASTALVSRAYGAGLPAEYRNAAKQSLGLAAFGGVAICGIAMLLAQPMALTFLPAGNDRAVGLMTSFLIAYSFSLPALYLIQVLAGSLRGIGDTKSPMVISGIQIFLHIMMNYLFIFPPQMVGGVTVPGVGLGLTGAGVAFTISAWTSALVYLLYSRRTPLGSLIRIVVPALDWTKRIVKIAAPAAVMAVLRVASLGAFILVLKDVASGSEAIAAMRAGFTIESMMFMPAFGLSIAASALVGQSLGAKNSARAERLAWVAGHHAALVSVALALPIFLGADWIASHLIPGKPLIAAEAANFIRYLCVTEVMFGYAMVMIGAMQGAGDTVRPLWITVVSLWLIRVPLAWFLAQPMGMGATGAWIAMSVTQAIQGALAIWFFKRGAWKSQRV